MRVYKNFLIAAAAVVLPATALQAMTIAVFLEKAERLERRGAMALFSSDIGLLKKEAQDAGAALKAEREAAQRAGRQPAYCPPSAGGAIDSRELLASFRTIPAAQRGRLQVRDGLRAFLVRKYPCRT